MRFGKKNYSKGWRIQFEFVYHIFNGRAKYYCNVKYALQKVFENQSNGELKTKKKNLKVIEFLKPLLKVNEAIHCSCLSEKYVKFNWNQAEK